MLTAGIDVSRIAVTSQPERNSRSSDFSSLTVLLIFVLCGPIRTSSFY